MTDGHEVAEHLCRAQHAAPLRRLGPGATEDEREL
jgi:hypothetical protein